MINITYKFITEILTEAALDDRIESGIIEVSNPIHIEVLAEHMFDRGLDATMVAEIVNRVALKDGKYPERQAFNKDGWLVTFPSQEYKNAAIKRGTHFVSDPTHGKGGMNLYYKSKGKQGRDKSQDMSVVDSPSSGGGAKPAGGNGPAQDAEKPAGEEQPTPDGSQQPKGGTPSSGGGASGGGSPEAPAAGEAPTEPVAPGAVAPSSGGGGGTGVSASPSTANVAQPVAPVTPDFTAISIAFAKKKGWTPTPYGSWRDVKGDTFAVVGLTGEVVPINSTDRDELKLVANKNQPGT